MDAAIGDEDKINRAWMSLGKDGSGSLYSSPRRVRLRSAATPSPHNHKYWGQKLESKDARLKAVYFINR